jgi:hypothetical protein
LQRADNPAGLLFKLAQVGQRGVNVRQALFVIVAQGTHHRAGRRSVDIDRALDIQGPADWLEGPQTCGGDVGFQYEASNSFSVICKQVRQFEVFGDRDSYDYLLGRIDAENHDLGGFVSYPPGRPSSARILSRTTGHAADAGAMVSKWARTGHNDGFGLVSSFEGGRDVRVA